MSGFFEIHPMFDILTGTDMKNALPWDARHNAQLTKHNWSAPYPVICSGIAPGEVEDQSRSIIADPQYLVLGISPATCSMYGEGAETWTLTLIVQRRDHTLTT